MGIRDTFRRLFLGILRAIYNRWIRTRTDRIWAYCNGFFIKGAYRFDRTLVKPWAKSGLVASIQEYVEDGDCVIEVGTGPGLAALHAADAGGWVASFEAGEDMVRAARKAVEFNNHTEHVQIYHAVVGIEYDSYGSTAAASQVAPADLLEVADHDQCDVLIMDCEGAEVTIIPGLEIAPRVIICETHPSLNAPTELVSDLLAKQGYDISLRLPYDDYSGPKRIAIGTRECNSGDEPQDPNPK